MGRAALHTGGRARRTVRSAPGCPATLPPARRCRPPARRPPARTAPWPPHVDRAAAAFGEVAARPPLTRPPRPQPPRGVPLLRDRAPRVRWRSLGRGGAPWGTRDRPLIVTAGVPSHPWVGACRGAVWVPPRRERVGGVRRRARERRARRREARLFSGVRLASRASASRHPHMWMCTPIEAPLGTPACALVAGTCATGGRVAAVHIGGRLPREPPLAF